MILHLLRHAEAEDQSPTGRDSDRELTDSGAKRMRAVARAIAKLGEGYDAVLVSPFVRSRQTAEPVADACGFGGELTTSPALLPNADPEEVLRELESMHSRSALLVGHQPHLGRLFGWLISGNHGVEVPMKKASLAAFDTDGAPGRAELRFYLPAKVLERLG